QQHPVASLKKALATMRGQQRKDESQCKYLLKVLLRPTMVHKLVDFALKKVDEGHDFPAATFVLEKAKYLGVSGMLVNRAAAALAANHAKETGVDATWETPPSKLQAWRTRMAGKLEGKSGIDKAAKIRELHEALTSTQEKLAVALSSEAALLSTAASLEAELSTTRADLASATVGKSTAMSIATSVQARLTAQQAETATAVEWAERAEMAVQQLEHQHHLQQQQQQLQHQQYLDHQQRKQHEERRLHEQDRAMLQEQLSLCEGREQSALSDVASLQASVDANEGETAAAMQRAERAERAEQQLHHQHQYHQRQQVELQQQVEQQQRQQHQQELSMVQASLQASVDTKIGETAAAVERAERADK
ncbi:unnamed protein product, partial [Ectocarpus fasciculatus]